MLSEDDGVVWEGLWNLLDGAPTEQIRAQLGIKINGSKGL